MRIAPSIVVSNEHWPTLVRLSRGRATRARPALRSKIVLRVDCRRFNEEIAAELGTGIKTVCQSRRQFAEEGLEGIEKDALAGDASCTRLHSVEPRPSIPT